MPSSQEGSGGLLSVPLLDEDVQVCRLVRVYRSPQNATNEHYILTEPLTFSHLGADTGVVPGQLRHAARSRVGATVST